jgi:hypothetical protein
MGGGMFNIEMSVDTGTPPPISVLPEYVEALNPRGSDPEVPPEWILALRPPAPLLAGTDYALRIPGDLPFAGSTVGLAGTVRVPFRTLDPPGIVGTRFATAAWSFAPRARST